MSYKWHPLASQKRQFAENMKNPEFEKEYIQRKQDRENKRRSTSNFDYQKAGGYYMPTQYQHDFCFQHSDLFNTATEKEAMNHVLMGFSTGEKVHHDFIHIVNEIIRNQSIL